MATEDIKMFNVYVSYRPYNHKFKEVFYLESCNRELWKQITRPRYGYDSLEEVADTIVKNLPQKYGHLRIISEGQPLEKSQDLHKGITLRSGLGPELSRELTVEERKELTDRIFNTHNKS